MIQVQLLNDDLHTGHMTSSCRHDVITGHESIYVHNSSQNLDKTMGEVLLCFTGHENIYVNDSSQNLDTTMGEVLLYLSFQDASNDLQFDLTGSFIRSGHLTWPKVKFSNWPFGINVYMFRCVLTRGIRWFLTFFSLFLSSKVIRQILDLPQKATFLVWPALRRSKCDLR